MTRHDPNALQALQLRLATYQAEYGCGEEKWALRCCELAMEALLRGDYGVGAVLLNPQGECLLEQSNRVFSRGYDSAGHAEMRLLDQFEEQCADFPSRQQLTLMVSLEPCPMCSSRILAAGIGRVCYLAADPDGGMLSRLAHLPPAWQNLGQLLQVSRFPQAHELARLAKEIAAYGSAQRRANLLGIIRPERL
ncbi:nucleoside deaminase [Neptuniibacter halophilus]|uniref:nucleoside deaminase n=1 Tax=Neptuniibacter halophilus TaxID=651666 RepID=UPI00257471B0|nr:nucleoside deaminase [Neptuniibacter halophilus]